MTAWIYCRVSTGEQARNGTSLQYQAEQAVRFIDSRPDLDLTLGSATNCGEPGVFVDESSAYRTPLANRAGGRQLLSNLQRGDTVIFYDISRGWRSLLDFSKNVRQWIEWGIRIVFIAYPTLDLGTANGRLTASVIAAYAEWKSAISSERQKEIRALREENQKKNKGPGQDLAPAWKKQPEPNPESEPKPEQSQKRKSTNRSAVLLQDRSVEQLAIASVLSESRLASLVKSKSKDDPDKPCSVYGYVRVSTVSQSLDSQIRPVELYVDRLASALNAAESDIITDHGVSALKTPFLGRPGGSHAASLLKRGDHIVFLRPDRAFRSVRDMLETIDTLSDRGVTIHLAESGIRSGDMSFQMMMQIMTLISQIESEENSRRVRDAGAWMLANGFINHQTGATKWITRISIDGVRHSFIPNMKYISDCRKIIRMVSSGMSKREAFRRMELVCAARENRPVLPDSGASRAWLMARWRQKKDVIGRRWEQIMRQPGHPDDMLFPTYRVVDFKKMVKAVSQYRAYLNVVRNGGRPGEEAVAMLAPAKSVASK